MNERPIDEQPWVYKLILLSLQNGHSTSLNSTNRNSLLSDLLEVMPCMMRQEETTLSYKLDDSAKLYSREVSNGLFMANYALKLRRAESGTDQVLNDSTLM